MALGHNFQLVACISFNKTQEILIMVNSLFCRCICNLSVIFVGLAGLNRSRQETIV